MRKILHIPNSHASTSEAGFEKKVNRSKDSRAIRVGGATQVTDQRLDMPCQKSARNRVEAFRTTQSDLSLFMISRLINELIRTEVVVRYYQFQKLGRRLFNTIQFGR